MLEEMSSIIHSTTNDSWILEKILVRAIGRKASTDSNGTIFGMGQISYAFQILGNYFVENELFMILHITGPKKSAADLIIFRGGSKGPGALFWLIFFNRWTINSSDTCGRGVSIPLEMTVKMVDTLMLSLRKSSLWFQPFRLCLLFHISIVTIEVSADVSFIAFVSSGNAY